MVLIVIGSVIAVLVASAAWYYHRTRRQGEQVSVHGDFSSGQTSIDVTRYERR